MMRGWWGRGCCVILMDIFLDGSGGVFGIAVLSSVGLVCSGNWKSGWWFARDICDRFLSTFDKNGQLHDTCC